MTWMMFGRGDFPEGDREEQEDRKKPRTATPKSRRKAENFRICGERNRKRLDLNKERTFLVQMQRRVTLRDIAAKTGISHAAVSLALKNSPEVSKETRRRVQKLARQMGYKADPMLSALSSYRMKVRPASFHATLAFINRFESPAQYHINPNYELYLLGARERAEAMGYKVEELDLVTLGGWLGVQRVLRARNCPGILLGPLDREESIEGVMDFSPYAVVAFGFSVVQPRFHVVTHAQVESVRLAMRELRKLGIRRIGMISVYEHAKASNFLAGYLLDQELAPAPERIPPLRMAKADLGNSELVRWLEKYQIEAVLDNNAFPGSAVEGKLSVGRKPWVVNLARGGGSQAGIDQQDREIGSAGAGLLVQLIQSRDLGTPENRKVLLVDGVWSNGQIRKPS
jgi:DNA-binding LacI/PurR family transcriptional regulator